MVYEPINQNLIVEGIVALRLAKEVIRVQQRWRANAFADFNRSGRISRSLANSYTDWPCLFIELLSEAAEIDHFQPKLVINNVEILRNEMLTDDSTVRGAIYHDSLIWIIIALGANERCLPVVLVKSGSYYSYQAFMDFGFLDIFISLETSGRTPQEAKMHVFIDYFTHMEVTVVNPSMDKALMLLQKFAIDAQSGKILEDISGFGSSWRHPPSSKDPTTCMKWAKIQLMDFVQLLVNSEFGVNYLADCSLEILDDPAAVALLEDPYFRMYWKLNPFFAKSSFVVRLALLSKGSFSLSSHLRRYQEVSCKMDYPREDVVELPELASVSLTAHYMWS
ncbi:hypothetical protein DITRI_Ditri11bG0040600 [Diplodiscus trichospermus]